MSFNVAPHRSAGLRRGEECLRVNFGFVDLAINFSPEARNAISKPNHSAIQKKEVKQRQNSRKKERLDSSTKLPQTFGKRVSR
jgi:hypothetical protein